MNPQGQKIQLLADLILPLVGYYMWGWNLYFILFFFGLDLLSNYYFTLLKSRKIVIAQGVLFPKLKVFLTTLLYLLSGVGSVFLLSKIMSETSFLTELKAFVSYKEMGIPQLILLLPLITIGAYMQYKVQFLIPKMDQKENIGRIWNEQLKASSILMASVLFILMLIPFILFREEIYIWILLVGISVFRLFSHKLKLVSVMKR